MDVFGNGDLPSVQEVCNSFGRNPTSFLAARGVEMESFVQQSVVFMAAETRDDLPKVQIMLLWQQHVDVLFANSKRIEQIYAGLTSLLLKENVSANLQSQILFTITSMFAFLDVQGAWQKIFASFVNKLFDYAKQINSSPNRLIRAVAVDCLCELESQYPGLLYQKLGWIYTLAQEETTHVFQNYLVLCITVFKNFLPRALRVSPDTGFLNSVQKNLFSFPDFLLKEAKPLGLPRSEPVEAFLKDIKRCVSLVIDSATLVQTSTFLVLLEEIFACVQMSNIPAQSFKDQFLKFASTQDLSLIHALLLIRRTFSVLFLPKDDEHIIRKLVQYVQNSNRSDEERILVAQWLRAYPLDPKNPKTLEEHLHDHHAAFYPTCFDSFAVKEELLLLLVSSFHPTPSKIAPPSDILNCLQCLDEFRFFGVDDTPSATYFLILFEFMRKFPELNPQIQEQISTVVQQAPAFIVRVTEMIDKVSAVLPESTFPIDTLRTLSEATFNIDVDEFVAHARAYINLLNRISMERSINPMKTIACLLRVLKNSNLCQQGVWTTGNDILGLCRTVLFHYPTTQVFGPLRNLLIHLAKNFADVDIRDQARFQYLMLTHVSREKLQVIMAPPSQPMNNPQDNPAGAFRMNSQIEMEGITIITPMSYPESQPIQYFTTPFFSLSRSPRKQTESLPIAAYISKKQVEEEDLLKFTPLTYLSHLRSPSWRPSVSVNVELKFIEAAVPEDVPQKLFSVAIDFMTQTKFVTPVKLKVPYLEKFADDMDANDLSAPERFPYFYRAAVHFQPTSPTPAGFKLMATFTNVEGRTFQCPLEPFQLFFDDLFLPISESLPEAQKDDRLGEVVFSKMWSLLGHLSATQGKPEKSQSPIGGKPSAALSPEVEAIVKKCRDLEGYETVKYLELSHESVQNLLQFHFSPFIVSVNSEKGSLLEEVRVVNVLLFLPPKYHLLLHFRISPSSTVVNIRTDNWRTLTYLDTYLDSLRP